MEEEQKFYTIILRHDESTKWMINNPILALGEYGVEDDTHRVKRGDGISKWEELTYEHFGLEYLVTFENILGEVKDNEALQQALNEKIPYTAFDNLSNGIVTGINIVAEENGIGKITKLTRNIMDGGDKRFELRIISEDQSVQGTWSVDEDGIRILNLNANPSISDYQPGRQYYEDQICFYNNRLYRAVVDFIAEPTFNDKQWVILASMHSQDIKYNNKISGLEAMTIKDAIDELQDLDSQKLVKSKRSNKVYGTTEDGQQIMIDRDDLRTVDSVNGKKADNQEVKNIQLDSSEINYDDTAETKQTIREVLDSKVDKIVAGEGAKIVRNVTTEYIEEDGKLVLKEDKVSLEDGSSEEEIVELNIVSETELANTKTEINNRITDEVNTLNNTITTVSTTLDNKIDTTKTELTTKIDTDIENLRNDTNERITNEVDTLNTTIDTKEQTINARIDKEVADLNKTITDNKVEINTKVDQYKTELDNEDDRLENKIDTNKTEINERVDNEVNTLNTRITNEVNTLNTTINTKEQTMNNKVDQEVANLNTRIDNVDNAKIDKDIADSLVTNIEMSNEVRDRINEPTLKITYRNTDTKTEFSKHLHFVKKGDIDVATENDHIVIDTTLIDSKINQNTTRLDDHDETLEAHNTRLNALARHDTETDQALADHQTHITDHEARMTVCEDRLDAMDIKTDDIIATHTQDKDELIAVNTRQDNDIANLEDADDAIRGRLTAAETNITDLDNRKLSKNFALSLENNIVGDLNIKEATNNEILILDTTKIDPTNNNLSNKILKVVSTDNTVIAKPIKDEDGNITAIDIATNLDTDVNYFVTTEIINTTIASETELHLSELTPTDKTVLELKDIVSDPEGTWARVKSIDFDAGTFVAVTFKKHAQAVWGTVKGNIQEQQDLQDEFNTKFTIPTDNGFGIQTYLSAYDVDYVATGYAPNIEGENYCNGLTVQTYSYNFNTGTRNYFKLLQIQTEPTKYDIVFKETENTEYNYKYITPRIYAENVYIDPQGTGIPSKLSPAIRELKRLDDKKVLITDFNTYKTEVQTALNTKLARGGNAANLITDTHMALNDINGPDGAVLGKEILFKQNILNTSSDSLLDTILEDVITGTIGSNDRSILISGTDSSIDLKVDAENIMVDLSSKSMTSTRLVEALKELKTIIDNQPTHVLYTEGANARQNDIVYCLRADGLAYMGIANETFTVTLNGTDPVEGFKQACIDGSIARFGIPQEVEDTPAV